MDLADDDQFFFSGVTCVYSSFAAVLFHLTEMFYFHAACYSTSLAAQQRFFTSLLSSFLFIAIISLVSLREMFFFLKVCFQILNRESQYNSIAIYLTLFACSHERYYYMQMQS